MKIKPFIIVLVFILVLFLLSNKAPKTSDITPQGDTYSTLALACSNAGGNYSPEFNECAFINAEKCAILGGTFSEGNSACRHQKGYPNIPCIEIPVSVCEFGTR